MKKKAAEKKPTENVYWSCDKYLGKKDCHYP